MLRWFFILSGAIFIIVFVILLHLYKSITYIPESLDNNRAIDFNQAHSLMVKNILKSFSIDIDGDKLKVNTVLNFSDVNQTSLSRGRLRAYDKILSFLPEDLIKEIYIGFDGYIYSKNTRIMISENSKYHVGDFTVESSQLDIKDGGRIMRQIFNQLSFFEFKLENDKFILQK